MSFADWLERLQDSALSHWIAKSNHLVIASLQVVHLLGFLLLLASLLLLGLRLLGAVLAEHGLQPVARQALRLLWLGLCLAGLSGILMFIGSPKHYIYNPAFDSKMLLLAAALLQAQSLRGLASRQPAKLTWARLNAVLSLILWFSVSVAARAIGFV